MIVVWGLGSAEGGDPDGSEVPDVGALREGETFADTGYLRAALEEAWAF